MVTTDAPKILILKPWNIPFIMSPKFYTFTLLIYGFLYNVLQEFIPGISTTFIANLDKVDIS